ncbi:MAG: ABC transporter substrate-binding protein [Pseudonocardia sp.]|nr:ABC transporter substrate-binding protein [Pseudonocardia sp.]
MGRRTWIVLLVLVAMLTGACTNEPVRPPAPPAPSVTPTPTAAPDAPKRLVVGTGKLPAGFNPHLLADTSPVTQALATLVLPSVFRVDAAGVPQLDTTVATSATVTSTDPFTVSYELNLEAAWSTNAPIAAEDFVYLWEQMRADPAVADDAGYRLITAVRSRAGGKAVDVEFARPYPAWKHLFSGLLPAHLLKDAPGSWVGALRNGLPASGGPFKVGAVDRARGQVVLVRNDLYWGDPTILDELVLREVDPSGGVAGIASGNIDLAVVPADPQMRRALADLAPAPHIQPVPRAEVVTLGLRSDTGPLRSIAARQAIAGLVDREAIRQAVAPAAPRADAFVPAPSQPGYAATAPPRPDAAAIAALLAQAGWTRAGGSGRWHLDGDPVRLVIGAGAERRLDQRVAAEVAEQLTAAGITTTVVAPPAVELFGSATVPATPPSPIATPTPSGATPPTTTAPATTSAAPITGAGGGVVVDLMVLPRPAGGDEATALASDFGCTVPGVPGAVAMAGPTGFCQPLLDTLLFELMTPDPRPELASTVERLLWEQAVALPLFQPVGLVVSTSAADAATSVGPGPLGTGPLTGAQDWRDVPS